MFTLPRLPQPGYTLPFQILDFGGLCQCILIWCPRSCTVWSASKLTANKNYLQRLQIIYEVPSVTYLFEKECDL